MKHKYIIVVLFLMVAGLQITWAQKMVVTKSDNTKIEIALSEVKEVTFEETEADPHEYVDLGLPSGTLWATCNIGANSPEEYGDYFAWGETDSKDEYDWRTYQYCNGSSRALTKYCCDSSCGNNGLTDSLTELLNEDDAATANWGREWQMPSKEQCEELINSDYTTLKWTWQDGVHIISKTNGKSIFLPAAGGCRDDGYSIDEYEVGLYWSRTICTSVTYDAECLCIFSREDYRGMYVSGRLRMCGLPIRPVRKQ